jgi:hypothetical protein
MELRCNVEDYLCLTINQPVEQRGKKGSFTSASRFCRAFDEVRQFFRVRSTMKQKISLAEQREMFGQRLDVLKAMVAMT